MARALGSVGERELELLRWIEGEGDATVGEAAEGFGDTAGLARSTVLTMMERLRKKRLLERRAVDGIYRYRLAVPAGDVARSAVAAFVEGTLGGSLAPFVAYLAESERLSDRQVKALEALLDRAAQAREEELVTGALVALGSRIAGALLGASLAAVLLVGACALLLVVWRRLPPRIGAALWWLVALRILLELGGVSAIVLPLLPASTSTAVEATASYGIGEAPSALQDGAGRAVPEQHTPATTRKSFVERKAIALVLPGAALAWLAGLAIVIALELRRWTRLAAVVRRARPAADPRIRVAWAKASAALGLGRRVPLLVSDEVATPMVVGLFSPCLLLPSSAGLAGEELRLVLLHELAHVRRRDAVLALVPALARRLFWFHPLVRFAEREFALATEAACDAEVLVRTGAEPARYGRLLVRFASARDEGLVPALAFAAHPLERRVRMLVSAPLGRRHLLFVAPLVLLVALAVALPVRLVAAPPAPPSAPAAPATPAAPSELATPPAAPPAPEVGRRQWRTAEPPVPAAAPVPPASPSVPAPVAEAAEPGSEATPVPPAPPSLPAPPAPPALFPAIAARPALPALAAPPIAPLPALPALSAHLPIAPTPPAPPFWSQLDPGDAIVFRDGDTQFVVNASSADRRRARELAADGLPVALIRRSGSTWVVRDRASIDEIREWIDEGTRLERQRAEELRADAERLRAELEGRLSEQRTEIEARARDLAEHARELSARQAERAQELASVDAERLRGAADAEVARALAESRRSVESSQRAIERAHRELARQATELDRQRQHEFGALHRTNGRDLRDLLDRLAAEGRAEELPK